MVIYSKLNVRLVCLRVFFFFRLRRLEYLQNLCFLNVIWSLGNSSKKFHYILFMLCVSHFFGYSHFYVPLIWNSVQVTLSGFRSGKFMTLVATNVAARGLDINDVQLIIQVLSALLSLHLQLTSFVIHVYLSFLH